MFSGIKRLFGAIEVKQHEGLITVEGVPADILQRDISKVWSTSKLNSWMFTSIRRSDFTIPEFFAAEVTYMLEQLKGYRYGYVTDSVVDKIVAEMNEHTWLKNVQAEHAPVLDFSQLKEISFKLLSHQLQFLEMYNRVVPAYGLRGLLLSAAPGAGKTITSLSLASCLKADKVFILSPKNAVYRVWEATIRDNLTHKPSYWIAANSQPYADQQYMVFHYETLDQAIAIAGRLRRQGKLGKAVIILDESHNFNEMSALRTNLFLELRDLIDCQHTLLMSGTPMKALGAEAIPLLRAIDPLFTPDTEHRFKQIYGRNANRALDILKYRLGLVSFKVAKADIQKDKPIEHDVQVQMPNGRDYTLDVIREDMRRFINERMDYYRRNMKVYERHYYDGLAAHERTLTTLSQRQAYNQYRNYVATIRKFYDPRMHAEEAAYCKKYERSVIIPSIPQPMREPFKNSCAVIKYVFLKVMGEALGGVLGRKRAQCHADMVPHMGLPEIVNASAKKTVIFTSYVEVLKRMEQYFRGLGYSPVVVYGDVNSQLSQILHRFEQQPQLNPLITTYPSLSTAVPLVMANTAIFTNQPFRDYEKNQAQARVDRLGQDTQVHFFNVYLNTGSVPNISTRSADILEWSRAQVEAILGTDSTPVGDVDVDSYYASNEGYHEQTVVAFESFFNTQILRQG